MPPFEEMDRYDDAVYWERIGTDRNGRAMYAQPIALEVRWEDTKTEMRQPDGTPVMVSAQVHTIEELPMGSLLYLGTLQYWVGTGSSAPTFQPELHMVVSKGAGKSLKGEVFRKTVGVNPYRGKRPDVT